MLKSSLHPREFALHLPRLFIFRNGINNRDDIEMIALHHHYTVYTSLKDLMPLSPPSAVSPTCCRGEIPIKDPLLKHAAWAYLQPMMAARQSGEDQRWWRRFHHNICWLLSCFNDVVLVVLESWFPKHVREGLLIEFGIDERESIIKQ